VQFLAFGQANSSTSQGDRTEMTFFTSFQAEALFGQSFDQTPHGTAAVAGLRPVTSAQLRREIFVATLIF
jgi:hypothetical protein